MKSGKIIYRDHSVQCPYLKKTVGSLLLKILAANPTTDPVFFNILDLLYITPL